MVMLYLTYKLSIMSKKQKPQDLDTAFEALANKHRREIIHALSLQPCSMSQLDSMRGLSLAAVHKHLQALGRGGMIICKKIGRTNCLALNRKSIRGTQGWSIQYHDCSGSDDDP